MAERMVKFILTGDSRGAVRAMREAGDASAVTGEKIEKTGAKAKHTGEEFTLMGTAAHKTRGGISMLAGAAGLGGLAFGLKDAVEAGTKWQTQQAQLKNALKNTGQASAETLKQINEAVDRSSTHGGFKGQEQTGALAQFVRLTGSSTAALKLNTAATALARGAGMSYATAIRAVSQLQTGSTGRLQKYIGILQPVTKHVDAFRAATKMSGQELHLQIAALRKAKDVAGANALMMVNHANPAALAHAKLLDKQATAQAATTALMQKFGGATDAYGKTAAGALSNAQHAIEQVAEKLGVILLPLVTKAAQGLLYVVDVVKNNWPQISAIAKQVWGVLKDQIGGVISTVKDVVDWFGRNKDAAAALGVLVGTLGGAYLSLKVAQLAVTAATKLQVIWLGLSRAAMVISIIATADLASASVGLGLAITAAGGPVTILIAAIAALTAAAVYSYYHFKTFRKVVDGVFGFLKTNVPPVVNFVIKHWRLLTAPLTWPFQMAYAIIKKVIDLAGKVPGIVKSVGNAAKSIGNTVTLGLIPGLANGGVVRHFATGGAVRGFAPGGHVGGSGTSDTVPAMLTPGEFVLRRAAVQALGVSNLNSINQSGAMATMSGGPDRDIVVPITLKMGSRVVAEEVTRYSLKMAARR
jgi:hypothetical protein